MSKENIGITIQMNSDTRKRICKSMPKVELHAHLNGSISEKILHQVDGLNGIGDNGYIQNDIKEKTVLDGFCSKDDEVIDLDECFQLFTKIHEKITTPKILSFVTFKVIEEFSLDNVVYLELRTTPKTAKQIPNKDIYIESVVQAIIESQKQFPIVVKLMLSVDRKMSVQDAEENVQLAIKWAKKFPHIICGFELSGNPLKGQFLNFLPLFDKARSHNLPISLHLPEVMNAEEALLMLRFRPERVGHAVFLHGNQELWAMLKEIPVEVCLTSNVVTKCSKSYEEHHVKFLHEDDMPFVVSTDDSGVFRTTLTAEYEKLVKILNLSIEELRQINVKSADYMFATMEEKNKIRSTLNTWWNQYLVDQDELLLNSS